MAHTRSNPYLNRWRLPYGTLLRIPPIAKLRSAEERALLPLLRRVVKPGEHVLEIGSGTGRYTEELMRLTPNVICIEESGDMSAELYGRFRCLGVTPPRVIFGRFPDVAPTETFDHVIAIGVLEYVPDHKRFVETALGLARKTLLISAVEKYPLNEIGRKVVRDLFKYQIFTHSAEELTELVEPYRAELRRAATSGTFAASTLFVLVEKNKLA